MPTETFYKLNEKKRKRFMKEAYKEFALNSYEAASVSNLVKTIKIAKGSVYQYFTDKEDLYTFLVKDAVDQLDGLLNKACAYQGEEFFEWYTKLLLVEVKFLLSFPTYAILFRNVRAGIGKEAKLLSQLIEQSKMARLRSHLPSSMKKSPIHEILLGLSSQVIFDLLTRELDLTVLIKNNDPVYVDSADLYRVCNEWVGYLRTSV